MKHRLLLFLMIIFAAPLYAGTDFQLFLQPQSRVWLTGDSTLHPYASTATVTNLSASFVDAGAPADSIVDRLERAGVNSFTVVIPVDGLKSGEKGLDKNLGKAMKSKDYPFIEFNGEDHFLLGRKAGNAFVSKGKLTIAGVTKDVEIAFQAASVNRGIHLTGTQPLLMTDYGIKPPTILGMIKTRNEILIHFDLTLAPEALERKN